MVMRPRDLCSAAFADDVPRLRQLIRSEFPPADDDEEDEEEAVEALRSGGAEETEESDVEPDEELSLLRRSERRRRRHDAIAALLCRTGLLVTPETGETCGFLFRVVEAPGGGLVPIFKASPRSTYEAAPLHWAVLGRARRAVEFIVASGADAMQTVPDFPGVTAVAICAHNSLHETGQCLVKAIEARELAVKCEEAQSQSWRDTLDAKRLARERQAALDAQAEEAEEAEEEQSEEQAEDEERVEADEQEEDEEQDDDDDGEV